LFVVGGIIGLILLIPVCIYVGAGIALTISASNGGLKFLGPDCNGIKISITGKVQSPNHESIKDATVQVSYSAMDNSSQFSFTVETDTNGHFAYEKSLSIFVCEDIGFVVSAKGFKTKNVSYSLFDDHREAEISGVNVNKINIAITLERSS
jgi:hypothetical protein